MVFINEWLPNPIGNDKDGEWIELKNEGSIVVNLKGWLIKTESGDKFLFPQKTINPGEFLVLKREETKLVLRNTDERIFLYNAENQLIDESAFFGAAPEGKSFSRQDGFFVWNIPTMGYSNEMFFSNIVGNNYSYNKPINQNLSLLEFLGMLLISSAIITFFVIFTLKTNDYLSHLFFSRN